MLGQQHDQQCKLVLASASPRRKELLAGMGVTFTTHTTNTDESRRDAEVPEDFVVRLARDKAKQAAIDLKIEPEFGAENDKDGVIDGKTSIAILAADTIVVQGNKVFGKPEDFTHAKRIWSALSANSHQVMTAVCLMVDAKMHVKLSITDVEFGSISEPQMQQYWDSGEPCDKAGAYAIQGFGSAWVKRINGSYSGVVGLPLREVSQLLAEIGLNWL